MLKDLYDITIIGAGPTGLFAAFYAGMRNAKVKVIDALPTEGGQVTLLYPEKKIYDIGGFPSVTGKKFTEQLLLQIRHFDHSVCLNEKVNKIEKKDDFFLLHTNATIHYSRTVIIATGAGAFEPRRLHVPGADQYEDKGLQYLVHDPEKYRDKRVAVCGGGDSAVDWALELEKTAAKVYLIHRRKNFRAHEYPVSLLERSTVDILTPYTPVSLEGTTEHLSSVTLQHPKTKETKTINTDFLIVNYGYSTSGTSPFLSASGIQHDSNGIRVNAKMETNIPGIYAAGDAVWYEGKVKLIATGFGDAPTAVNHAVHFIDPTQRTQPIQSTQLDL